ncbi:MAG: serine O-acetyltransferase [Pseudoruegeria sp.]
MNLVKDVSSLLSETPQLADIMNLRPFDTFAQLSGALFAYLCKNESLGNTVQNVYANDDKLVETTLYDVAETARRNFEPGGAAASLLFSRGVQAIMAHRVAHKLWVDGNINLSQAIKCGCGQVFTTDIHPAAQIGAGIWLDHGLGFVVGETSVIEEDVSIWHNVTLGSTLNDSGAHRHPHIGRGAVLGAGSILLGNIKIGANVNVAAGSIVVNDVPEGLSIVGAKATLRGPSRVSFAPKKGSSN